MTGRNKEGRIGCGWEGLALEQDVAANHDGLGFQVTDPFATPDPPTSFPPTKWVP